MLTGSQPFSPDSRPIHWIRRVLPFVALSAATALYLSPFLRLLMHGPDEGSLLHAAERVAAGEVPFRDFFEAMGPGTFYWVALFFKLFGVTWFASRAAFLVSWLITSLVLFWLGRRLRVGWALVPAIILMGTLFGPGWPTVSHHGDSTAFALLSFAALLRGLDTKRPFWYAMAGVLAGCTAWTLQPKGVFLYAAFLAVVWRLSTDRGDFWKKAGWLSAGFVAVMLTGVLYFWRQGALQDLIYANVLWPWQQYGYGNHVAYGLGVFDFYWKRWSAVLVPLLTPVPGYFACAILLVPFVTLVALPWLLAVLAFFNRRAAFARESLPYWAAGAAIWLSEIHRKDIMHLAYGSPVLLILLLRLCRFEDRNGRWGKFATEFVAVCAVALALFNGTVVALASNRVVTARGTVRTFGPDAILSFLQAHAGEEIFAYPGIPTNYFLAGARNPTRYSLLIYRMHTEAQFREAVRSLEDKQVRWVIWDTILDDEQLKWTQPFDRPPLRSEERIVETYLRQNYDVISEVGTTRVLERKTAAPTSTHSAAGGSGLPAPHDHVPAQIAESRQSGQN